MGLSDRDYVRDEHKNRSKPSQWSTKGADSVPNYAYGIVVVVVLVAVFISYSVMASIRPSKPKATEAELMVDPHERLAQISPINVNVASYEDLRLIPGVSHNVAEGIISSRPYKAIDDLDDVYGIGPKTLDLIRPHVSVD